MNRRLIPAVMLAMGMTAFSLSAQTAASLFMRSDSLQVKEVAVDTSNLYTLVGHHGPAVENCMTAFRIYFNDSGSIDVYSKSGKEMELMKYLWYPDEAAQLAGSGVDQYKVGSTVGLGGIALWDGEKEVKLVAEHRTARVGKTRHGHYAEMIAYGVALNGDKLDVSIRVDVRDKDRIATVTARELHGRKLCFMTGVNYHKGAKLLSEPGRLGVWCVHPEDVAVNPGEVGSGLFYKTGVFGDPVDNGKALMIVSKPRKSVKTKIVSSSTMEDELGSCDAFMKYMESE